MEIVADLGDPGENPDPPPMALAQPLAGIAGILQDLPGGLQKEPLLRIHVHRFHRQDLEKERIKLIKALQKTALLAVTLSAGDRLGRVGMVKILPALPLNLGDTIAPLPEILPVSPQIRRFRVAAAKPDDRNGLLPAAGRPLHRPCLPAAGRRLHRPRLPAAGRRLHRPRLSAAGRRLHRLRLPAAGRPLHRPRGRAQQFDQPAPMIADQIVRQSIDIPHIKEERAAQAGKGLLQAIGDLPDQNGINPVGFPGLGGFDLSGRHLQCLRHQPLQIAHGRRPERLRRRRNRLRRGGRLASCFPPRPQRPFPQHAVAFRHHDLLAQFMRRRRRQKHRPPTLLFQNLLPRSGRDPGAARHPQRPILGKPPAGEQPESQMAVDRVAGHLVQKQQAVPPQRGLGVAQGRANVRRRMQDIGRHRDIV
ncbi:MAG: hypothetical protein M2R46_05240 [Verrucomicrobia subdivision 3 bacterium]|nr:hypothetical protein [Limisphaerales bacterium]